MANNLAEVFRESAEKYGNLPAFYSKDEKKNYIPTNYKELYEMGLALAEALIDLGVSARENVGQMADNRLEWIITDYGILMSGAANVPRGTDVTESELTHILTHSEAKVVFVEHDKMLEKLNKVKSQASSVKTIIMMDPKSTATGVLKLYDLIAKGKELRAKGSKKAEERVAQIKPDDLFTLIYTSGTTGAPKGVMLMHSNMMHQLNDVLPLIKFSSSERMLSILPVWHIFERVFEYISIKAGASTYYTNVRDLRDDLGKAQPTFMGSAPRLWESIYLGIYTKVNDPKITPPVRRAMFNTAYFFSKHFHAALRFLKGNEVDYEGRNIFVSLGTAIKSIIVLLLTGPFTFSAINFGLAYGASVNMPEMTWVPTIHYILGGLGMILNYFTLDKIVLAKIRMATGGKLKASVSGGGALPRHVDAFFNDIGINVLEGYGMTETCPVIGVRTFDKLVMGSVGPVVPHTKLQIRDDKGNVLTGIDENGNLVEGKLGQKGVIHVKGPQVMKGYYKNPEATSKTLKDGWMDTGDIGMINFKMTLTLTGRAKDTVVLLGGENVEPVPIENKLTESNYISQCMVVGQDQKILGAIIVPDFDKLKEWCAANGIADSDPNSMIKNPKVNELIKKEIKELNNSKNGFKSFEQVTPFYLTSKPFEVGDELTNLMKLKRHVITEKYNTEIKKLYN